MKAIAIIPARYEASRFPGKLLMDLFGKPVLQWTYEGVSNSGLFQDTIIATDDQRIAKVSKEFGASVFMSTQEHKCGTDRIAEVALHHDADIVINIQGDTPMIDHIMLARIMEVFRHDTDCTIDLVSLMFRIRDTDHIKNPNAVKVVVDRLSHALYFSRSPIPYVRGSKDTTHYQHVGVYAFRKAALLDFYNHPMTPLESAEQIEGIRYLEIGKKIKMLEIPKPLIDINTPEDLESARHLWATKT